MYFLKAHFGVNRSQISNLPSNIQDETDDGAEDELEDINIGSNGEFFENEIPASSESFGTENFNQKSLTENIPKQKKKPNIKKSIPSASMVLQTYLEEKKRTKTKDSRSFEFIF